MPLSDEELAAIDPIENLEHRPPKDEYFLAIASVVAMRSFDPSSKCGCVIVSKDGRVLSTGYNGPVKSSIDKKIPLTRPERYYHMIHAEENALLAYSGSYEDIQGSTVYLTGSPCHRCLRMMIQKGIARIVRSDYVPLCVDEQDKAAQDIMLYEYEYGDMGLKGRRPRINIVNNQSSEIVVSILDRAKNSLKENN